MSSSIPSPSLINITTAIGVFGSVSELDFTQIKVQIPLCLHKKPHAVGANLDVTNIERHKMSL